MVEIVEIWDLMLVEISKTRKKWNGPNRRKEQPFSLFYNSEINLQNLDQISQILTFQTATISFPSASEEEDHDQIMASSAIKTPHRRLLEAQFHVLAVDDSPLDRKLIEKLLQISSYQVTTVDSGIKALQFLGLQEDEEMGGENDITVPPEKLFTASSCQVTTVDSGVNALEFLGLQEDEEKRGENDHTVLPETHHQDIGVNLIITDYCMPEMTGYDLLRKIKQSKSMKDTPVVIMSSEDNPSRINRCLEEGAEEFILKPVKMGDVRKLRPIVLRGRDKENADGNNTGQPQMSDTTNMHINV